MFLTRFNTSWHSVENLANMEVFAKSIVSLSTHTRHTCLILLWRRIDLGLLFGTIHEHQRLNTMCSVTNTILLKCYNTSSLYSNGCLFRRAGVYHHVSIYRLAWIQTPIKLERRHDTVVPNNILRSVCWTMFDTFDTKWPTCCTAAHLLILATFLIGSSIKTVLMRIEGKWTCLQDSQAAAVPNTIDACLVKLFENRVAWLRHRTHVDA